MTGTPLWVVALIATIYGCLAYLATRAADALYKDTEPPPDSPPLVARPPVTPLIVGAFAVGWAIVSRGAGPLSLLALAVTVVALCASYWTDLTRGIVADLFTLPALALLAGLGIARHDYSPLVAAVVVALPFAVAALVTKGRGVGWGDVKLIALGATVMGLELALIVYAVAALVACAIALAQGRRTERIAFAPYLIAAIAAGMLVPVAPHLG